ncbi:hypothetical protein E3U44_12190 [Nitrosococcus wardiae]|uniref:Transposase IS701-like DDE domain-containing protein n=1 Tax=Nitrosococcus wardiae TaxID=1814290 RepID=A0A4P7BYD2_9GAMM|nr:hypothetical protein E3U44_12190 [Nitrosococcus wardiae]
MSSLSTAQRKFMKVLLTTWMCLRGKATFRNLSCYSQLNEKTYARWFRRPFDFVEFNRLCLADLLAQRTRLIAVMDCSFSEKSGRHTYGLDKFYNSTHYRAQKGLEISTLAFVDVEYATAYSFSTRQTPPPEHPDETRVDGYLQHLREDRHALSITWSPTAITAKRSLLMGSWTSVFIRSASFATTPTYAISTRVHKNPGAVAGSTTARCNLTT